VSVTCARCLSGTHRCRIADCACCGWRTPESARPRNVRKPSVAKPRKPSTWKRPPTGGKPGRQLTPLPEHVVHTMRTMRANGASLREIARALDLPFHIVRYRCNNLPKGEAA